MGRRQRRASVKGIANRTLSSVLANVVLHPEDTRSLIQEEEFPFTPKSKRNRKKRRIPGDSELE
jgi:hypothetical protein